ncbi:MAG: hypothetical protein H6739_15125 [Alphaproteobacteria bacterium]|nr:hypothetical protein [Alphaproteobacteria bacterium]
MPTPQHGLSSLIGLLSNPDPDALRSLILPPAPRGVEACQPAPASWGALQDGLVDSARAGLLGPGGPKRVVLLIGCSRSGSTVMMRLFGAAGLKVFNQPLKNALRHRLVGLRYDWRAPPDLPVLVIKSTLGQFVPAECLFDPIGAILAAGLPPEQLRIVELEREPAAALASWRECWGDRLDAGVLEEHFVLASLNLRRVVDQAARLGVGVERHALRLHDAPAVHIARLFDALGLGAYYHPGVLEGWPPLRSPASNILTWPEPVPYRTERPLHSETDRLMPQDAHPSPPLPAWVADALGLDPVQREPAA